MVEDRVVSGRTLYRTSRLFTLDTIAAATWLGTPRIPVVPLDADGVAVASGPCTGRASTERER